MIAQFLQVIWGALVSAITDILAIGTVIVVLAFAMTLILKEVPPRRSHGLAHVE